MIKIISLTIFVLFTFKAHGFLDSKLQININQLNMISQEQAKTAIGLNWIVGESVSYKVKLSIFSGKAKIVVASENKIGFWVENTAKILGQKQFSRVLFNKRTGEVEEVWLNGKKEDIADDINNPVITDQKQTVVNIPIGSFDCFYFRAKIKDISSEFWHNPRHIPIYGMLMQRASTSLGRLSMQVTDYEDL